MNRIQILPDSVKKRIAAGEVVEGPFSVVKELMENSIDAGATAIDVEILDSGLKKILVRDNGSGILRDDLSLAVMEHATSKIRDDADIGHISSFGFRGEALSSVSSISRITIFSRAAEEESGGRLSCREGSIEMSDYAGPVGSSVIVENLFYNTPARKKFLKSHAAELRNIKSTFLRIALAHPKIAFTLGSEEKRLITLGIAGDEEGRIGQVYGEAVLKSLYSDTLSDLRVEIHGFLSKPDFLKSTRSMQLLYVNGRPVEYRYLGFLLSRAYEAIAPRGRYPAAIIFLNIDPQLIDVNIHPAKKEIKFFDQKYIDSLIDSLCRKILGSRAHPLDPDSMRPVVHDGTARGVSDIEQEEVSSRSLFSSPLRGSVPASGPLPGESSVHVQGGYSGHGFSPGAHIGEAAAIYHNTGTAAEVKTYGIVFDTYILFESGDSLHFIDYHAAHERFIYDELMKKDMIFETQQLMFPVTVELSPGDCMVLSEQAEKLSEIGFDMDVFPENTVVIRGVPEAAGNINLEEFIQDFVESLKAEENGRDDLKNIIARETACHTAKRSNDELNRADVEAIIHRTMSGAHELRCPHGRPYLYRLDRKDLERMFKRA